MMGNGHPDLLILGAGSTAFAAALRAQELGRSAVMIEARTVGGTCVTRGCLPSKNLIEAARLLHEAKNPRFPGLSPVTPELNFPDLIAQKDEIVRAYRDKKYESLVGGRVNIEKGRARFLDGHTVEVDGKLIRSERVLIATGSRPVVPPIEGLDATPYLTSDLLTADESMELAECPRSLLVVGGGYIALELGQMFSRFGADVTIVEQSRQVLPRGYEPEVGRVITEIFREEGIRVVTSATVRAVRQEDGGIAATASVEGALQELRAARLLIATGRRPNTDAIAIENAGVWVDGGGQIQVDEYLRTNIPHIFAAGDVIGGEVGSQMATPVGSQDGGIAAHNALSGQEPRAVNHRVIPRCMFTHPQVATVGLTDKEAVAAGHRCWCSTVPMSLVPRAGATRDTRGMIKMVANADTDEVLGVTMVGHNAGEVIHEAAMAMRFHAKVRDFVEMLHVYPTMSEALKIAALSRYKDPAKLSCCAE